MCFYEIIKEEYKTVIIDKNTDMRSSGVLFF